MNILQNRDWNLNRKREFVVFFTISYTCFKKYIYWKYQGKKLWTKPIEMEIIFKLYALLRRFFSSDRQSSIPTISSHLACMYVCDQNGASHRYKNAIGRINWSKSPKSTPNHFGRYVILWYMFGVVGYILLNRPLFFAVSLHSLYNILWIILYHTQCIRLFVVFQSRKGSKTLLKHEL